MDLFEWFKGRIGQRVHLAILGVPPQSWRVHLAGTETAVLVQPSTTRSLDQLCVYYSGITCFADTAEATDPGDVVGSQWDRRGKRWIPFTLAELRGEPRERVEGPDVPDHLPEDIQ